MVDKLIEGEREISVLSALYYEMFPNLDDDQLKEVMREVSRRLPFKSELEDIFLGV